MASTTELRDIVGEANCVDSVAGHPATTDLSARSLLAQRAGTVEGAAVTVVRPGSSEEVAGVLRWASSTGTPVFTRGGGSGVCGGTEPRDGVVLDTTRLDSISGIDEKSLLVTVEAGVFGDVLEKHLNDRGFTLGHAPQSIAISTVGGWLATKACGQLSSRYGGIELLVAGLQAALPDGSLARSGPDPRSSRGPDVASLMLGSEGTLGVVTEAVLRIRRLESERADLCIAYEHMSEGVRACRTLAQSELLPSVVRLYDRDDVAIAFRKLDDVPQQPLLLLTFEGEHAEERADSALKLCGGERASTDPISHWWAHRNDAVSDYSLLLAGEGPLGPHAVVDTMEVSGTWSSLRALYHSMKDALGAEAQLVGCHLSHIYVDGACLYFTLASACSDDDEALAVHERWWEVGMETCLANGGSISHHHGIGRLKAKWLPEALGSWWEVLVAVKSAIDPARIMNPGALGL